MFIKKAKTSKECDKMVAEAAAYIKQNSRRQAEIFFDEFDRLLGTIEQSPESGSIYRDGMRRIKLGKFKYYIYYREQEYHIEVLGIWHTRRGTGF